jgi:hypothetical protein
VPTLNRFPLLGLWAAEAARRAGYRKDEAESLGHAYAVLYAIRANRRPEPAKEHAPERQARRRRAATVHFGGDDLEVVHATDGHLRGRVGGEQPQTPASYRRSVRGKFPPGYYERLQRAFRRLLKAVRPSELKGRLTYDWYDEWKKACGVGRLVDLDRLLRWAEEEAEARRAGAV